MATPDLQNPYVVCCAELRTLHSSLSVCVFLKSKSHSMGTCQVGLVFLVDKYYLLSAVLHLFLDNDMAFSTNIASFTLQIDFRVLCFGLIQHWQVLPVSVWACVSHRFGSVSAFIGVSTIPCGPALAPILPIFFQLSLFCFLALSVLLGYIAKWIYASRLQTPLLDLPSQWLVSSVPLGVRQQNVFPLPSCTFRARASLGDTYSVYCDTALASSLPASSSSQACLHSRRLINPFVFKLHDDLLFSRVEFLELCGWWAGAWLVRGWCRGGGWGKGNGAAAEDGGNGKGGNEFKNVHPS